MHITFDLETLGSTYQAPIVQIGAVKFTDEGEIKDKFLRNIDLKSLEPLNFKVNYSTLGWWMSQKKASINSVFLKGNRVDLAQALNDFTLWVGNPHDYFYWSHANFDTPILENAYKEVGLNCPLKRRRHRDIRTLCHLTGDIETKTIGIKHNALDDCITQANYISKRLQMIAKPKNKYSNNASFEGED